MKENLLIEKEDLLIKVKEDPSIEMKKDPSIEMKEDLLTKIKDFPIKNLTNKRKIEISNIKKSN